MDDIRKLTIAVEELSKRIDILIERTEPKSCPHKFLRWAPWQNGIYRLYCVECNKWTGSESALPMDSKQIENMGYFQMVGGD